MAGGYRKITVSKVCIAEICFRKKDVLFNEGKVVLDIDTFDFAGFITNDVIVGYYRDGKYKVYYYYNFIEAKEASTPLTALGIKQYSYGQKEFELEAEFHAESFEKSFINTNIIFAEGCKLTFKNLAEGNMEELSKVVNANMSLLITR